MSFAERRPAKKKCCVPNCAIKDGSFFSFPNPKKEPVMLQKWLAKINNPILSTLPLDKLHKSYLVCARHFLPADLQVGCRRGIKWNAVPMLHIGTEDDASETEFEVPAKRRKLDTKSLDYDDAIPTTLDDFMDNSPSSSSSVEIDMETAEVSCTLDSSKSTFGLLCSSPETPKNVPDNSQVLPSISRRAPKFTLSTRRCAGIPKQVHVTRQNVPALKAKYIYKKVIDSSRKMAQLSDKLCNFKVRLKAAEKLSNSPNFKKLVNHVNTSSYKFILCQVRAHQQKPKARRFTIDEKLSSLAIFKASGEGYRLLSQIFTLPSTRTLTNLLNKIPLTPGINQPIFDDLKKSVLKMKPIDRLAILVFDEMTIDSSIYYNSNEDNIIGLHDEGNGDKKPKLADHANVFLLKGVFRQWKQPVCYTFSSGPTKSASIKKNLIDIIRKCHDIGLTVVATVCNEGVSNRAAINQLLATTEEFCAQNSRENKHYGFLVDDREIIPLFDVPRLFKGLRNNLLTKYLHFTLDNKNCIAKWLHIEQFYFLDVADENRLCAKLTERHALRGQIDKMKVSCCTQVFSHRVGVIMTKILNWKCEVDLDAEAIDTANLIFFLDKLFDSLNSSGITGPPGKPYKAGVTKNSYHIQFWHEAIEIISTMKYFCPKKQEFFLVPTLKNLIRTLKGFIYLSEKILDKYKKKVLAIRPFQLDALENFFGCIRNYSGPISAEHFQTSFKALIANNLMCAHPPGANCEEDESEGLLNNLRNFVCGEGMEDTRTPVEPNIPSTITTGRKAKVSKCTSTYISGVIAKNFLKKVSCINCRKNLMARRSHGDMYYIEARQYDHSKLTTPCSFFHFLTTQSISRLFYLMPRLCHSTNIFFVLENILANHLDFYLINCPDHGETSSLLISVIIRCCLFFWCKRVNFLAKR